MSGEPGNEGTVAEQLRTENEELRRKVEELQGKREKKELKKLDCEIRHLKRPWCQPAVIFGIVAAIAAAGGMLAQRYLSSIKAEKTQLKRDELAKDIEMKAEMVSNLQSELSALRIERSSLQSEVSGLRTERSSLKLAIADSRIALGDVYIRIAELSQEMPKDLAPQWADLAESLQERLSLPLPQCRIECSRKHATLDSEYEACLSKCSDSSSSASPDG